jgi:hypothetical protein
MASAIRFECDSPGGAWCGRRSRKGGGGGGNERFDGVGYELDRVFGIAAIVVPGYSGGKGRDSRWVEGGCGGGGWA